MPTPPESQPTELFIRALTEAQTVLRGYCLASLGHGDEAKEALQRTSITLWRKCGDWDPSTDFLRCECLSQAEGTACAVEGG
jgi:DNA-directed RNA polymerase specialized sigma24 family protein